MEIEQLKALTMKPPIFATHDTVREMRVKAQTIRMFGGGFDGHKSIRTPSDTFVARDLERRATKLERELIVEELTNK